MDADSTVVIKVKYGDILRRFRARVIDGEFSLTMDGLRKKIFSLFGFSPDKEITLTYIDEDGDVATFVDFVDLCDVVKQGINPIRFTVNPILENDSTKIKFCGSSNPLNLPSESDAIKVYSYGITETVDYLQKAQPIITNSCISEATMGNDSLKAASSSNGCNNTNASGKEKNSAYTSAANLGHRYPFCGTSASYWSAYCDICGTYPKTVYRFNSKGICTICFKEFEKEINKLDERIAKEDGKYLKQLHLGEDLKCTTNPQQTIKSRSHGFEIHRQMTLSTQPRWICYYEFENPPHPSKCTLRTSFSRHCAQKLDCCFVEDVTVAEGSTVPPSTRFTKTWRMRNNGSDVWPEKTRLVWTGGHDLSHGHSFEVRIPATGLPVGHDLDISVDFTSPETKGYYTSYWIMESPSGEQFGELIWIYIQVDDALNHNLPPTVRGSSTHCPESDSVEQLKQSQLWKVTSINPETQKREWKYVEEKDLLDTQHMDEFLTEDEAHKWWADDC